MSQLNETSPMRNTTTACILFTSLSIAVGTAALAAPPTTQPTAGSAGEPLLDLSKPIIAFAALVDQRWDLFAWDPTGTRGPRRLTDTPEDELRPSIAGDRRSIAYETTDGRLIHLDLATGKSRTLPFASDQHFDMQPSISPDSKFVLLTTSLSRELDDTHLAILTLGSNGPARQLHFPSSQFLPCWAPDGVHLAFVNLQAGGWAGQVTTEIWLGRTEPPMVRQLTMLDGLSIDPSWTPDGKRVLFACNTEGQFDLYSVDVKDREVLRLTGHLSADTDPVISPDGKQILFVSTRGGQLGLWILDGNDADAVQLKPFGEKPVRCKDPDWR